MNTHRSEASLGSEPEAKAMKAGTGFVVMAMRVNSHKANATLRNPPLRIRVTWKSTEDDPLPNVGTEVRWTQEHVSWGEHKFERIQ